ncbi:MAG: transcription termination/antitermination protein NusG [Anaerolineales bacterium]
MKLNASDQGGAKTSPLWYVLHSKPRKEATLDALVRSAGYETYYPQLPISRPCPRLSPFFPGYLFVLADLNIAGESALRWMPFSHGLVHLGGEPAPVPSLLVQAIKARVNEVWERGGLVQDRLMPGDRVFIQNGAFEGYEGIFESRIDGSERVRILLKMLSDRYLSAEVRADTLEKVAPDTHQHGRNALLP